MRAESRTLLTGEPLAWQLTNAQRTTLGLTPVEPHWTLREVPCGLLAMCETYAYFDGSRVMRVISAGEGCYAEVCVDAALTEEGRIAPVKPGGKHLGGCDFRNCAIGWSIDVTMPEVLDCMAHGLSAYWDKPHYDRQRNLMNPAHAELLAAIRKQMKV